MSRLPLVLCLALAAIVPGFAPAEDALQEPGLGNLQVALSLSGVYYNDNANGAGPALVDGMPGVLPATGATEIIEGFNLGESELGLSATVDPWLDAYANIAFNAEGAGVEEAALVTRAMPAGWQVRAGKFLSAFGYQNGRHAHTWDFVDQNLAYDALVGSEGIKDTGVQVTWLPPLDTYVQVGAEILQGDQEKFGAAIDLQAVADTLAVPVDSLKPLDRHGPQLYTAFLKLAPDLGTANAVQLGASLAVHRDQQEMQASGSDLFYARGDVSLLGFDGEWKHNATSNYGLGSARLQGEYLRLVKHLDIVYDTVGADTGKPVEGTEDAFYLQGVYGFAPRWEAGLRYELAGLINHVAVAGNNMEPDASQRVSAAATFRPSEFSFFRVQVARAAIIDAGGDRRAVNQLMLQYNLSLGAHSAHAF